MLKMLYLKKMLEKGDPKKVLTFFVVTSFIPLILGGIFGFIFISRVNTKREEGRARIEQARESSSYIREAAGSIVGDAWEHVHGFNPLEKNDNTSEEEDVYTLEEDDYPVNIYTGR